MSYWCMCLIIIVSAIVLKSSADNDITVLEFDNHNDGLGNSGFRYKLSDGSSREESVKVENKDTENENLVIQGMYSYIKNAVEYRVRYVADINGYRPEVEIVRLLKNRIPSSAIATLQGGGIG